MPPLGVTRPDQIKTIQGMIGAKRDGVWGAESQAAYRRWQEKMETRQQEAAQNETAGRAQNAESARDNRDRMPVSEDGYIDVKKAARDAANSVKPYRSSRQDLDTFSNNALSEVGQRIGTDGLNEYEKQLAYAVLEELPKEKIAAVYNAVRENGAKGVFGHAGWNTAAKRILEDEGKYASRVSAVNASSLKPSLIRPHYNETSLGENAPQVECSYYYYEDGRFYTNIYLKGAWKGRVDLGNSIPLDTKVSFGYGSAWTEFAEQVNLIPNYILNPRNLTDAWLMHRFSDNSLTSLPIVDEFLDKINHLPMETKTTRNTIFMDVAVESHPYKVKMHRFTLGHN